MLAVSAMRTLGVLCAIVAVSTACPLGKSGSSDGGTSGGLLKTLAGLVGFEGEIEMVTTGSFSSSSSAKMLFTVKKDKLRIELPGMPMLNLVFLIDGGKKKMWWLAPSARTYTEMPLPTTSATPTPVTKPTATKTGKTDTVAGYSCDEWQVQDAVSHVRTVVCVSSGLSFLGLGSSPLKDLGGGTWMDAVGTTGFPLRAETIDATGTVISKMEATRVEKKSEPDSLFEIPPGYTSTGSLAVATATTTTPPKPLPTGRPLTSARPYKVY